MKQRAPMRYSSFTSRSNALSPTSSIVMQRQPSAAGCCQLLVSTSEGVRAVVTLSSMAPALKQSLAVNQKPPPDRPPPTRHLHASLMQPRKHVPALELAN
jgi:hypothetical protein